MSEPLDASSFPLWGSRLIEASAGTGKTWTIAALYVRLVLGHGRENTGFSRPLMPSDILVMTFTRAATRELSDRIRARLLEAARCFRDEAEPKEEDTYLHALLADYPDSSERQMAAWRLAMAAECMDEASVFTIDAWAQRALREHAFDSGSLFEEELVADEQALQVEAAQDYWRRQCYGLNADELAEVLKIWPSLERLLSDVRDLLGKEPKLVSAAQTLTDVIAQSSQEHRVLLESLRAQWRPRVLLMRGFVESQNPPKEHGWDGRKFSIRNITGWLDKLQAWAEGKDATESPDLATGWKRLAPDGLREARSTGAGEAQMTPQEAEAFEAFATLELELQHLPKPETAARLHAAASVADRMRQLKRQNNKFGFSDMLDRLDAALKGANGERLRERILAQYPVVLIDEFQDTSPVQYGIFNQIYRTQDNAREHALFLIGDPKQSIYGFRGADIYSYLQARDATQGRHYALSVNYRSTATLVQAVNHGFIRAEQQLSGGAFDFRTADNNPLPFAAVEAKGRPDRWVCGGGDMPAITVVYDLQLQSMGQARKAFAERCAQQVVEWLNDPANGFEREGQPFQRLSSKDIAILVRTGKEAAAVRRALQKRNVASVYLSDKDSVFQSDEARDLVHWLCAVATPQDAGLVRAALALTSVGLSLSMLSRLANEDTVFDEYAQILRELRQVWLSQGVLAMLRQSLHRFGLAASWLALTSGERSLTNYLHLAELLQNASSELEGEQALIRWLMRQISEAVDQNEEQVVRLESDADLVKIVTVHKSKGLEYPVVCLPFSTSFRGFDARLVKTAMLPTPDGGRELVLDMDGQARDRYEQERMREDLRLLYVAMTRPRHGLWLGFSAVKVGNSKSCVTHQSAMGRIVGGLDEREAEGWLDPLQDLARECPGIAVQSAPGQTPLTGLLQREAMPVLQDAPEYLADFDRTWSIASYSRLTRDLKRGMSSNSESTAMPMLGWISPLQVMRPADDEALDLAPGKLDVGSVSTLSGSAVSIGTDSAQVPSKPIWHSFKRGPITGNFLHELLERLCAESFAIKDDPGLSSRLRARCEREGYEVEATALVDWMTELVNMRLPGLDVSLVDLKSPRAELEFWLPSRQLDTARIDQLCREHLMPTVERPGLQSSSLHGMLMGFMDLVFEHDGRYWVLDYKSNALGTEDSDYDSPALMQTMAEHRYDVQAAIYALALHRLLKARMGSRYVPSRHLGGAAYLFLRGIHGPAGGVCTLEFPEALLKELDSMLEPARLLAA